MVNVAMVVYIDKRKMAFRRDDGLTRVPAKAFDLGSPEKDRDDYVKKVVKQALDDGTRIVIYVNRHAGTDNRNSEAVSDDMLDKIKASFETNNIIKIFNKDDVDPVTKARVISSVSDWETIQVICDCSLNFHTFTTNGMAGCHMWWLRPLNEKDKNITEYVELHERAVQWFNDVMREKLSSDSCAREGLLDRDDDLYVQGDLAGSMKKMAAHFADAHMDEVRKLFSGMSFMTENSAREGGAKAHKVGANPNIPSVNDLLEMLKKARIDEALPDWGNLNVNDFDVNDVG